MLVNGDFCEVSTTLTFLNPHDRELEGQFNFPLARGSVVCGFALDIDGELASAAIVAKDKAKEVFEQEVRDHGKSAAVLESSTGNSYTARVWPLPPGGQRTVRVTYSHVIAGNDGGAAPMTAPGAPATPSHLVLRSRFFFARILACLDPDALARFGLVSRWMRGRVVGSCLPLAVPPCASGTTLTASVCGRAAPFLLGGGASLVTSIKKGNGTGRARVFSSSGKISAVGNLLLAVPHLIAGMSQIAIETPQPDPEALAEMTREKGLVACGTPAGDLAAAVRAEVEGSDPYFCICVNVDSPQPSQFKTQTRRVGVLWDTSLSGGGAWFPCTL